MTRNPRVAKHTSAPHFGVCLATIICLAPPHASQSTHLHDIAEADK